VNAKLESVEVKTCPTHYNDLAIKDAPLRQSDAKGFEQFGKVAVERLAVAALDDDLIFVAKNQGPESVPFRFEYPAISNRKLRDSFCEHRQKWRGYGKIHGSMLRLRAFATARHYA